MRLENLFCEECGKVHFVESVKKAQSIVGTNKDGGRPEDDFYPTPRPATTAMLNVEKFNGTIWECACGKGSMSKALESRGYEVFSTDKYLKDYGAHLDFMLAGDLLGNNIVTNPPFKLFNQFVERASALKPEKFAFFGKLSVLEGSERSEILERTHLTRVWVFRNRVTLVRNGIDAKEGAGGMIAFAWFVWERGYSGRPMIGWI